MKRYLYGFWFVLVFTLKLTTKINKMFPQTELMEAIDNDDVDEEYCSDLDYRIKQFHLYKGGNVADVYYLNGDRFTKY